MSGGSYNYLYNRLEFAMEDYIEDLDRVVARLAELGRDDGHAIFESFVESFKGLLLEWTTICAPIAHAIEWVDSGDSLVDHVDEVVNRVGNIEHAVFVETSCVCGNDWPCPVLGRAQ